MAGFWNLPYTFASLSGNQPASYLDSCFQTLSIEPMYATAVSGTDTITMTVPVTFSGYQAGMVFIGTAANDNTTSGVTLNVNGQGAVQVVKENGQALVAGDIKGTAPALFYYDGALGTPSFHLLNPSFQAFAARPPAFGTTTPAAGTFTILRAAAFQETKVTISSTSGAAAVDLSTGNYFSRTIAGVSSFTVSNVPANLIVGSFVLDITNGGSAAVTWSFSPKWAGGVAPALTASGRDVLSFFTYDGGTTWNGFVLGKNML